MMTAMQTAKATQTVPDTGKPTQPIFCYLNSCFVLSKILRVCSKQTFCPRSYGLEEEDDENLDENDDAIDAPAVSGCAGPSRLCNLLNSRIFTQVQAKKKKPAWPMLTTNLLETPCESCLLLLLFFFTHYSSKIHDALASVARNDAGEGVRYLCKFVSYVLLLCSVSHISVTFDVSQKRHKKISKTIKMQRSTTDCC